MATRADLQPLFEAARYVVGEGIALEIGRESVELDQWLRANHATSAALLTAFNPRGRLSDASVNSQNQAELEAALVEGGHRWVGASASGDGWPVEPMFAVFDLPEREASRLCGIFEQAAAVWVEIARPPRLVWHGEYDDDA